MFCPHCGKEIMDNDPAFCGNCGSRLASSSRAGQSPLLRRKRIFLYAVALACSLLGVVVFAFVAQTNLFTHSIFQLCNEEPIRALTDYENISRAQDGSETIVSYRFVRDSSGNITRTTYVDKADDYSSSITFEYSSDGDGIPTRCLDGEGAIVWEQKVLSSNETGLPLCIQRSYSDGSVQLWEFKYRDSQRIQELNSRWETTSDNYRRFDICRTLNENGNITQLLRTDERSTQDDDWEDLSYEYTYGNDGRLVSGKFNQEENRTGRFVVVEDEALSRSEEWEYPDETVTENYQYCPVAEPSLLAGLLCRCDETITFNLFGIGY